MTKKILAFGDSLTWGWIPKEHAVPTERYPASVRWTGVLADELGTDYELVSEGLSGRTTTLDDPTDPRLNGADYLPAALASHLPLDLVILMLGTNDTKAYFNRSPLDIVTGVSVLVGQILGSAGGVGTAYPAPAVLLVAPPELGEIPNPWFHQVFEGAREKSAELSDRYRALATFLGIPYFDAGSVISTDGADGIHLTENNNRDLGLALVPVVKSILEP
ncbi:SGNH/GDSL hydrolase family protein [Plantibacter flavus]|uniref:SGNH/GDSL hydrolase family protein n=1 Tax=Plantibacter flavus TaxID=150123 RepID=UPI003F14759D